MLVAINHLLGLAHAYHAWGEKLEQATGERFNIFQILRIASNEVTTHSPVLAELLDPRGRHGMGSRFLELFLHQLSLDLNPKVQVQSEYWAGPKTEVAGGRLDIFIHDAQGRQLVIENKIYSTDKDHQLSRYLQSFPHAQVLYLTLDGSPPTERLTNKRLRCISYTGEIIPWLETCRKEAAHLPLVRETLTQYINLLKSLAGQNLNATMQNEITKSILQTPETLDAYFTLLRSKDAVASQLIQLLHAQCQQIAESLHLQLESDPNSLSSTYGGLFFYDQNMKDQNLCVGFEFEYSELRKPYFGIAYWNPVATPDRTPVTTQFEQVFGQTGTPTIYWPAWQYWPGRENWWNDGTLRDILSGVFKKELQDKIDKLVNITRKASA
jgi:hypothetical protein